MSVQRSAAQEPPRPILDRLPQDYRGVVVNAALEPVRGGERNVDLIAAAILATFVHRAQQALGYADNAAWAVNVQIAAVLKHHPDEARDLARWALWYHRLPPAERQRRKVERTDQHRREWLDQQPASPKQLAYLRSLGYRGEVRGKGHASEIIDRLKRGEVV